MTTGPQNTDISVIGRYTHGRALIPSTDRSEEWKKAKELFINPTGYQDGGSSYGILLNGVGTGVVAFGVDLGKRCS